MWDDRAVFRALWQRIARLFGGGGTQHEERQHVPGGIPAPETLIAKVQNVKNKDRDILRVAGEAIRRGHPDQAVIAYWKAVEVYLKDGQLLKAISALKMILQHSPEDLQAFNALADAYETLERKRDAANTCLWIADIHARRGEKAEALAVLYRSIDLDPAVKGARERIQALGGELPTSARGPSVAGPPLRLQSKGEPPAEARPPSQMARPASQQAPRPASQQASRPASQQASRPASQQAGLPPLNRPASQRAASGLPPIVGIPLSAPPPLIDDPMEMPGDAVDDSGLLELDMEDDVAVDFPDDSLVLPVVDPNRSQITTPEPTPDPYEGTMLASEDEVSSEGDSTIAMEAIDAGAATIAMQALSDDGEMLSDDLSGDQTVLAMDAPPWDGPTDEHSTQPIEELTDPQAKRAAPPPRKFAIPSAATTVDISPPSAMQGSEHDAAVPRVGIPGDSTRAYSIEELRKLGVKTPKGE